MSGYRRFVTYLFQYEHGEKGANCGFAKVEVRQEECRIQLQVQGEGGERLPFYLLAGSPKQPRGIALGEVLVQNGAGRAAFLTTAEQIQGTPWGMDDVRGIYLPGKNSRFVASQWDDADTRWDAFEPFEEEQKEEISEEHKQQADLSDPSGLSDCERQTEEDEVLNDRDQQNAPDTSELRATQTAAAAPYRRADTWEAQWLHFTAAHPLFCPFDEDTGIYAVKMNLRDFRILPKQYWYLANNSFLLHGYFNYRYVLFGYMEQEQKRWFLGVPGVFQNQEQLLAGIFGFPEFRTRQTTRQKTGEFGYWYRYLDLGGQTDS